MKRIGFTGTRYGLTKPQRAKLALVLSEFRNEYHVTEFHHGDCIGADAAAHGMMSLPGRTWNIHVHPAAHAGKNRAYCRGDVTHKPYPPLDRNRHIVAASDIMVACPNTMLEELRSGTWATIRYAREANKNLVVILPNGGLFL